MTASVLLRGGGDLASGVAARLQRAGLLVLITELPQPLVVRRLVAFAEAVYAGETQIEEITARRVDSLESARRAQDDGEIPILVDPQFNCLADYQPLILIDARMTKRPPEISMAAAPLVIGLGPGFTAGQDCHAVIETMRGHHLGRVIWQGPALPNTGIPETVGSRQAERVLRAPAAGTLQNQAQITDRVQAGDLICTVGGKEVRAPFNGVLRGLLHDGLSVTAGMKIGDLDPRNDPSFARQISDKALAIGGGVLEAILSQPHIRQQLYNQP